MPKMMFRFAVAVLATTAMLATGISCFAATLSFRANLNGEGEVPPVRSRGSGEVHATFDTSTKTLSWTGHYGGLSGPVIGAHFHGPVSYVGKTSEENAPIQIGTPGNLASPFKGESTLTDTQAKDLMDGRWYFNIHTPANPAGEIRGQVIRSN